MTQEKQAQSKEVQYPVVYAKNPIFAVRKVPGPRVVHLSDGTVIKIGGNLIDKDRKAPALTIQHLKLLLILLLFRKRQQWRKDIPDGRVLFSFLGITQEFANSRSGPMNKRIKQLFVELKTTEIETILPGGRQGYINPIINDYEIITKYRRMGKDGEMQAELFLEYAEFHKRFLDLLWNAIPFDLEQFQKITSPTAQAIFAYIPSRATHRTQDDPFPISMTKLLTDVGANVPREKGERKRIFTQNDTPILKQLDGARTKQGVLRVRMVLSKDKADYVLHFWEEPAQEKLPKRVAKHKGQFYQLWIKSGGIEDKYWKLAGRRSEINGYEEEMLQVARIKVHGNKRAFLLAKSLIGESAFDEVLAECKSCQLEKVPATKNNTARFIDRLKTKIAMAAP